LKTLDEIALSYDTDKSSDEHFYTRYYEKILEPLRDKPIKLLEIGVQYGKSLHMWNEYLPSAEIFGIDIKNCQQYQSDRIHIFMGNSTDARFMFALNDKHGPFDIIIDDGSHHNLWTYLAFENLMQLIKPGGYYCIEDLHCSYWNDKEFGTPLIIPRLKTLLDQINAYGKSSYADRNKDKEEDKIISFWEKEIESFTLYRSLAIIKRW
jgi:SAM-dependent methyltransferase